MWSLFVLKKNIHIHAITLVCLAALGLSTSHLAL